MDADMKHTMSNGGIGLIAGAGGLITSALPHIESWLRILVLLASLVSTVMAICRIARGPKSKDEDKVLTPAIIGLVILFSLMAMSGCAPAPAVRGADGFLYQRVRKGGVEHGQPVDVELWKRADDASGEVWIRSLSADGSTAPPMFFKAK